MYLGIDVGASKTLLAAFEGKDKIAKEIKFATPKNYSEFIKMLGENIKRLGIQTPDAICCAIPGLVDEQKGIGKTLGNLPWKNAPVRSDLERLVPGTPVLVENDAKIAAVYEAVVLKNQYKKILYLTISTGIGAGIVNSGILDPLLENSEPGQMVLMHDGHLEKWEDFASGRALVKKYGRRASEIEEPEIWREFAIGVAQGLAVVIAVVQPEVVVIGGGVGAHLEKFQDYLESELQKYQNNMVIMPPIVKAKRPEEAVIYGCYEYIRQKNA